MNPTESFLRGGLWWPQKLPIRKEHLLRKAQQSNRERTVSWLRDHWRYVEAQLQAAPKNLEKKTPHTLEFLGLSSFLSVKPGTYDWAWIRNEYAKLQWICKATTCRPPANELEDFEYTVYTKPTGRPKRLQAYTPRAFVYGICSKNLPKNPNPRVPKTETSEGT